MIHQDLWDAACAVRERSWSPYSRFQVGAALLTESGTIYTGTNVENVSYGLTICAERSAVCAAVAAGERAFVRILVVAEGNRPAAPCGACRQVLAEFNKNLEIVMTNVQGDVSVMSLAELFPLSYGAGELFEYRT